MVDVRITNILSQTLLDATTVYKNFSIISKYTFQISILPQVLQNDLFLFPLCFNIFQAYFFFKNVFILFCLLIMA